MTSTNDGIDVKRSPNLSRIEKTQIIETFKDLDIRLSDRLSFDDRLSATCLAWKHLCTICDYPPGRELQQNSVEWIHNHTANLILQNAWLSENKEAQTKCHKEMLEEAFQYCLQHITNTHEASPFWIEAVQARVAFFRRLLDDPWSSETLKSLMDSTTSVKLDDEIVLKWLQEERGPMLVHRIQRLAASKCYEHALALTTSILDRMRPNDDKKTTKPASAPVDKTNQFATEFAERCKEVAYMNEKVMTTLIDAELVLLHKVGRQSDCIFRLKSVPLNMGMDLIKRLEGRYENEKNMKLWKNASQVAALAAKMIVARCLVTETFSQGVRMTLFWSTRAYARLEGPKTLAADARLLTKPAMSSLHLHTFTVALQRECTSGARSLICEMYIRTITAGMNELESMKLQAKPEPEIHEREKVLSGWFIQLSELLQANTEVRNECILTAFSIHPSQVNYEKVCACPIVEREEKVKDDDALVKGGSSGWASDSKARSIYVKNSETIGLDWKVNDKLGLVSEAVMECKGLQFTSDQCRDLDTLLRGPRVKTLSWLMDRDELLRHCVSYMEQTSHGTKSLSTELHYLNLNHEDYNYLPEEKDDNPYGIEKGYEHLIVMSDEEGDIQHSSYSSSEFDTPPSRFTSVNSDNKKQINSKEDKNTRHKLGSSNTKHRNRKNLDDTTEENKDRRKQKHKDEKFCKDKVKTEKPTKKSQTELDTYKDGRDKADLAKDLIKQLRNNNKPAASRKHRSTGDELCMAESIKTEKNKQNITDRSDLFSSAHIDMMESTNISVKQLVNKFILKKHETTSFLDEFQKSILNWKPNKFNEPIGEEDPVKKVDLSKEMSITTTTAALPGNQPFHHRNQSNPLTKFKKERKKPRVKMCSTKKQVQELYPLDKSMPEAQKDSNLLSNTAGGANSNVAATSAVLKVTNLPKETVQADEFLPTILNISYKSSTSGNTVNTRTLADNVVLNVKSTKLGRLTQTANNTEQLRKLADNTSDCKAVANSQLRAYMQNKSINNSLLKAEIPPANNLDTYIRNLNLPPVGSILNYGLEKSMPHCKASIQENTTTLPNHSNAVLKPLNTTSQQSIAMPSSSYQATEKQHLDMQQNIIPRQSNHATTSNTLNCGTKTLDRPVNETAIVLKQQPNTERNVVARSANPERKNMSFEGEKQAVGPDQTVQNLQKLQSKMEMFNNNASLSTITKLLCGEPRQHKNPCTTTQNAAPLSGLVITYLGSDPKICTLTETAKSEGVKLSKIVPSPKPFQMQAQRRPPKKNNVPQPGHLNIDRHIINTSPNILKKKSAPQNKSLDIYKSARTSVFQSNKSQKHQSISNNFALSQDSNVSTSIKILENKILAPDELKALFSMKNNNPGNQKQNAKLKRSNMKPNQNMKTDSKKISDVTASEPNSLRMYRVYEKVNFGECGGKYSDCTSSSKRSGTDDIIQSNNVDQPVLADIDTCIDAPLFDEEIDKELLEEIRESISVDDNILISDLGDISSQNRHSASSKTFSSSNEWVQSFRAVESQKEKFKAKYSEKMAKLKVHYKNKFPIIPLKWRACSTKKHSLHITKNGSVEPSKVKLPKTLKDKSTKAPKVKPSISKEKPPNIPKEKPPKMPKEKPPKMPKEKPPNMPKEKPPKMPKENPPKNPKENSPKSSQEKSPKVPKEKSPKKPKKRPINIPTDKSPKTPKDKPIKTPKENSSEYRNEKAQEIFDTSEKKTCINENTTLKSLLKRKPLLFHDLSDKLGATQQSAQLKNAIENLNPENLQRTANAKGSNNTNTMNFKLETIPNAQTCHLQRSVVMNVCPTQPAIMLPNTSLPGQIVTTFRPIALVISHSPVITNNATINNDGLRNTDTNAITTSLKDDTNSTQDSNNRQKYGSSLATLFSSFDPYSAPQNQNKTFTTVKPQLVFDLNFDEDKPISKNTTVMTKDNNALVCQEMYEEITKAHTDTFKTDLQSEDVKEHISPKAVPKSRPIIVKDYQTAESNSPELDLDMEVEEESPTFKKSSFDAKSSKIITATRNMSATYSIFKTKGRKCSDHAASICDNESKILSNDLNENVKVTAKDCDIAKCVSHDSKNVIHTGKEVMEDLPSADTDKAITYAADLLCNEKNKILSPASIANNLAESIDKVNPIVKKKTQSCYDFVDLIADEEMPPVFHPNKLSDEEKRIPGPAFKTKTVQTSISRQSAELLDKQLPQSSLSDCPQQLNIKAIQPKTKQLHIEKPTAVKSTSKKSYCKTLTEKLAMKRVALKMSLLAQETLEKDPMPAADERKKCINNIDKNKTKELNRTNEKHTDNILGKVGGIKESQRTRGALIKSKPISNVSYVHVKSEQINTSNLINSPCSNVATDIDQQYNNNLKTDVNVTQLQVKTSSIPAEIDLWNAKNDVTIGKEVLKENTKSLTSVHNICSELYADKRPSISDDDCTMINSDAETTQQNSVLCQEPLQLVELRRKSRRLKASTAYREISSDEDNVKHVFESNSESQSYQSYGSCNATKKQVKRINQNGITIIKHESGNDTDEINSAGRPKAAENKKASPKLPDDLKQPKDISNQLDFRQDMFKRQRNKSEIIDVSQKPTEVCKLESLAEEVIYTLKHPEFIERHNMNNEGLKTEYSETVSDDDCIMVVSDSDNGNETKCVALDMGICRDDAGRQLISSKISNTGMVNKVEILTKKTEKIQDVKTEYMNSPVRSSKIAKIVMPSSEKQCSSLNPVEKSDNKNRTEEIIGITNEKKSTQNLDILDKNEDKPDLKPPASTLKQSFFEKLDRSNTPSELNDSDDDCLMIDSKNVPETNHGLPTSAIQGSFRISDERRKRKGVSQLKTRITSIRGKPSSLNITLDEKMLSRLLPSNSNGCYKINLQRVISSSRPQDDEIKYTVVPTNPRPHVSSSDEIIELLSDDEEHDSYVFDNLILVGPNRIHISQHESKLRKKAYVELSKLNLKNLMKPCYIVIDKSEIDDILKLNNSSNTLMCPHFKCIIADERQNISPIANCMSLRTPLSLNRMCLNLVNNNSCISEFILMRRPNVKVDSTLREYFALYNVARYKLKVAKSSKAEQAGYDREDKITLTSQTKKCSGTLEKTHCLDAHFTEVSSVDDLSLCNTEDDFEMTHLAHTYNTIEHFNHRAAPNTSISHSDLDPDHSSEANIRTKNTLQMQLEHMQNHSQAAFIIKESQDSCFRMNANCTKQVAKGYCCPIFKAEVASENENKLSGNAPPIANFPKFAESTTAQNKCYQDHSALETQFENCRSTTVNLQSETVTDCETSKFQSDAIQYKKNGRNTHYVEEPKSPVVSDRKHGILLNAPKSALQSHKLDIKSLRRCAQEVLEHFILDKKIPEIPPESTDKYGTMIIPSTNVSESDKTLKLECQIYHAESGYIDEPTEMIDVSLSADITDSGRTRTLEQEMLHARLELAPKITVDESIQYKTTLGGVQENDRTKIHEELIYHFESEITTESTNDANIKMASSANVSESDCKPTLKEDFMFQPQSVKNIRWLAVDIEIDRSQINPENTNDEAIERLGDSVHINESDNPFTFEQEKHIAKSENTLENASDDTIEKINNASHVIESDGKLTLEEQICFADMKHNDKPETKKSCQVDPEALKEINSENLNDENFKKITLTVHVGENDKILPVKEETNRKDKSNAPPESKDAETNKNNFSADKSESDCKLTQEKNKNCADSEFEAETTGNIICSDDIGESNKSLTLKENDYVLNDNTGDEIIKKITHLVGVSKSDCSLTLQDEPYHARTEITLKTTEKITYPADEIGSEGKEPVEEEMIPGELQLINDNKIKVIEPENRDDGNVKNITSLAGLRENVSTLRFEENTCHGIKSEVEPEGRGDEIANENNSSADVSYNKIVEEEMSHVNIDCSTDVSERNNLVSYKETYRAEIDTTTKDELTKNINYIVDIEGSDKLEEIYNDNPKIRPKGKGDGTINMILSAAYGSECKRAHKEEICLAESVIDDENIEKSACSTDVNVIKPPLRLEVKTIQCIADSSMTTAFSISSGCMIVPNAIDCITSLDLDHKLGHMETGLTIESSLNEKSNQVLGQANLNVIKENLDISYLTYSNAQDFVDKTDNSVNVYEYVNKNSMIATEQDLEPKPNINKTCNIGLYEASDAIPLHATVDGDLDNSASPDFSEYAGEAAIESCVVLNHKRRKLSCSEITRCENGHTPISAASIKYYSPMLITQDDHNNDRSKVATDSIKTTSESMGHSVQNSNEKGEPSTKSHNYSETHKNTESIQSAERIENETTQNTDMDEVNCVYEDSCLRKYTTDKSKNDTAQDVINEHLYSEKNNDPDELQTISYNDIFKYRNNSEDTLNKKYTHIDNIEVYNQLHKRYTKDIQVEIDSNLPTRKLGVASISITNSEQTKTFKVNARSELMTENAKVDEFQLFANKMNRGSAHDASNIDLCFKNSITFHLENPRKRSLSIDGEAIAKSPRYEEPPDLLIIKKSNDALIDHEYLSKASCDVNDLQNENDCLEAFFVTDSMRTYATKTRRKKRKCPLKKNHLTESKKKKFNCHAIDNHDKPCLKDISCKTEFNKLKKYKKCINLSLKQTFLRTVDDIDMNYYVWPLQHLNSCISHTSMCEEYQHALFEDVTDRNADIDSFKGDEMVLKLGFGEGSDRVNMFQGEKRGKNNSARTLSDVKHRPVYSSLQYKNSASTVNATGDYSALYKVINELVQNFFRNMKVQTKMRELKVERERELLRNIPGVNDYCLVIPQKNEQVVNVVQVGKLPVTNAQQILPSCDPADPQEPIDVSPHIDELNQKLNTQDFSLDQSVEPSENEYDDGDNNLPGSVEERASSIEDADFKGSDVQMKGLNLVKNESKMYNDVPDKNSVEKTQPITSDSPANILITSNIRATKTDTNNSDPNGNNSNYSTDSPNANSSPKTFINILSQKIIKPPTNTTQQNYSPPPKKTNTINSMTIQQALAQILPQTLNQNTPGDTTQNSQILHFVSGKANSNSFALVDQNSCLTSQASTQLLHIVQNKAAATIASNNGSQVPVSKALSGLSFVETTSQQGGGQVLQLVNTGTNQTNNNATQFLKRVNLLTGLANVQNSSDPKMVQFVCKSADGKTLQLNAGQQRNMVLRLHPIETTGQPQVQQHVVVNQQKPAEPIDASLSGPAVKENVQSQEIKSRSVYEENYAKFIQNSGKSIVLAERSTSLPKFNQVFGKPVYQEGKSFEQTSDSSKVDTCGNETEKEPPGVKNEEMHLDALGQLGGQSLMIRKTTTSTQPVQHIKTGVAPVNLQNMQGGVIYTRQIPVNIGGGQTINLITVPHSELVDENNQKQEIKFTNSDGEQQILKIIPQSQTYETNGDQSNYHQANEGGAHSNTLNQVLSQMRIKLPMLSKTPQMMQGARLVRPILQIQRNVLGGVNQPVYQQLVLTTSALGQQTIRLPQPQTKPNKQSENQTESNLSTSTLEQLREFDMVLEQVKERSTTVLPNSSPTTSLTKSNVTVTSVNETPVLYSIAGNQTLFLNRKIVQSPDSSDTAQSPSSTQVVSLSSDTSNDAQKLKLKSKIKSVKPNIVSPNHSAKSTTPSSLPPKPSSQKPLEDEQTTQRILYILAEYKEQVENSPDKDKPAPRRRSNPPTNPGSSKKKKGSSSKKQGGRDSSPVGGSEDMSRTMGSEDSSCGTSQGDCAESCASTDAISPQSSPRKTTRKLTFDNELTEETTPNPRPQQLIVTESPTIAVTRATPGKPATAVLMPANYLLPVSMVKGGQQIAIVTNRGPKILTLPQGEGGPAANTLLLQRLIGHAGLKPFLARPGVRHVRLPTTAVHNLQQFTIPNQQTTQPSQGNREEPRENAPASQESWSSEEKKATAESDCAKSSADWNPTDAKEPGEFNSFEPPPTATNDSNNEKTVLGDMQEPFGQDCEAQRIFEKMFDFVDSRRVFFTSNESRTCESDVINTPSACEDKVFHQVVPKKDLSNLTSVVSHGQTFTIHQKAFQPGVSSLHSSLLSQAALRHRYAMLENELRLQKSLSEECEDLGVDSPSASDLFPEADLLFSGSPAQLNDHSQDSTTNPENNQVPVATHEVQHQQEPVIASVIIDEGDGTEALGPLSPDTARLLQGDPSALHEDFARSHPNTTFHSEPVEDEMTHHMPQFAVSSGVIAAPTVAREVASLSQVISCGDIRPNVIQRATHHHDEETASTSSPERYWQSNDNNSNCETHDDSSPDHASHIGSVIKTCAPRTYLPARKISGKRVPEFSDQSSRRISNRGVVKRGCHCCNGDEEPKTKKPKPKPRPSV